MDSTKRATLSLLFLWTLAAVGCAVGRIEEGAPIDEGQVRRLRAGMTKREVLELFGPPEEFRRPELLDVLLSETVPPEVVDPSAAIFNDVYSWRHVEGKLRLFTVILFTWIDLDVRSDDLIVFFDEDDRVKTFAFRRGTIR